MDKPLSAPAPCTGENTKNGLSVFERGENLLQNGILPLKGIGKASS